MKNLHSGEFINYIIVRKVAGKEQFNVDNNEKRNIKWSVTDRQSKNIPYFFPS